MKLKRIKHVVLILRICTLFSAQYKLRGVPNKQGGWEDFFVYHIKNSGECRQIFRLVPEKHWEK